MFITRYITFFLSFFFFFFLSFFFFFLSSSLLEESESWMDVNRLLCYLFLFYFISHLNIQIYQAGGCADQHNTITSLYLLPVFLFLLLFILFLLLFLLIIITRRIAGGVRRRILDRKRNDNTHDISYVGW